MKMKAIVKTLIWSAFIVVSLNAKAQTVTEIGKYKKEAIADIQSKYNDYSGVALQIWNYAEVGYKEYKSSALLQKTLTDNGFNVESSVAGIPTAFVATYGTGKPVIGILAEFDALPGLSQDSVPIKSSLSAIAGHGCGHNLFGTASVAAGIELKKLMIEKHLTGTIKVYGCPAEEGGGGKVYMVRAGLFNDVDVVLHWHPGANNDVQYAVSLAVISAKFRFYGIAAHAAVAPDKGRSALDAVESMDYLVNMMREHVPSDTRIHYIITDGGKAPNVVPDFAESYYMVRNYNRDVDKQIFDRVVLAAKGAALGTGTRMEYELIDGDYDVLPNKTLAVAMQKDLNMVGGVIYTPEETAFAKKLQSTFAYKAPPLETAAMVDSLPAKPNYGPASTDVGDVSWTVPTIGLSAATWVPGVPAHSWQATACGGMGIGFKGMMVAAKTIALTGIDLLTDPTLVTKAKAEFETDKGAGFQYKAMVGDRKVPLDYRDIKK
jgi:aminobenzoyl-glutamate utilization protein B